MVILNNLDFAKTWTNKNFKMQQKKSFTHRPNSDLTNTKKKSLQVDRERASFVFQSRKSWKMLHAECLFFIKRNKKSQIFLEGVFRPQVLCFVGAMGELVGIFFYYSKIKILIRKKTTIFNFSVLSDHKRADQRRMSEFSLHTTIHV